MLRQSIYAMRFLCVLGLLFGMVPGAALPQASTPAADGPATIVKDINTATMPSDPRNITPAGSVVYFSADEGVYGNELWRSDGTPGGTRLVKDINPGMEGGWPHDLVVMNGTLFFTAHNDTYGRELWRSDGTAGGTLLVKDITPGPSSSLGSPLTRVGSRLFFIPSTSNVNCSLWQSDGTAAGTTMLFQGLAIGYMEPCPTSLTDVNGTLFFVWPAAGGGYDLLKSSFPFTSVAIVKHFAEAPAEPPLRDLTNVGGKLFFTAASQAGFELWQSDGTASGTVAVTTIGGQHVSNPAQLTNVNGVLFCAAGFGTPSEGLWKSNGTPAGTLLVKPLSQIMNLHAAGNNVFVGVSSNPARLELWRSDGTSAGTTMLKRISSASGPDENALAEAIAINSVLYFAADDGQTGNELWRSDGTAVGTAIVKDIFINGSSAPAQLTNANGRLFFTAATATNLSSQLDVELWTSNGTAAGTTLVNNINRVPVGSSPQVLGALNGRLLFAADDGYTGVELWRSDSSAAGTALVKDIAPGWSSSWPGGEAYDVESLVIGSRLFFGADDGVYGMELWQTDGTAAGTTLVKDIAPGYIGSDPSDFTNVNGVLFFVSGNMLWKSDGTTAGTVAVSEPLTHVGYPNLLTAVNGTLFFVAFSTASECCGDYELWKSDGTTAGTVRVKDIVPGPGGSNPSSLTALNGLLLFKANAGSGYQLWRSDGTQAGTIQVHAVSSNPLAPGEMRAVNGRVYFEQFNGYTGQALWSSDGTPAGTSQVKAITGDYRWLTDVDGTLFFVNMHDNAHELWKSDGTAAGTVMVKSFGTTVGWLSNVSGTLIFAAQGADGAYQLWKSDGTAAGTTKVSNLVLRFYDFLGIFYGLGFVEANSRLFFSADDGHSGQELAAIAYSPGVATAVRTPARVGGAPGTEVRIPIRYDNTGLDPAHSIVITATLDSTLKYLGSDGPPPNVQGNTLTWNIARLGFLDQGELGIRVRLPQASLGTIYNVQFSISSAEAEATPGDNTISTELELVARKYLPLVHE